MEKLTSFLMNPPCTIVRETNVELMAGLQYTL